jgi:hypothetical protein
VLEENIKIIFSRLENETDPFFVVQPVPTGCNLFPE